MGAAAFVIRVLNLFRHLVFDIRHSSGIVSLAERQRRQASNLDRRVRLPQDTLDNRVGSSAAEQVLVKYQCVGSSPTRPSPIAG